MKGLYLGLNIPAGVTRRWGQRRRLGAWPNFAAKARLLLGFKGLSWRSVKISPVMPKPDLTALTGGYRRVPLLQVGNDVFCDTGLMADVLALVPASVLQAGSRISN